MEAIVQVVKPVDSQRSGEDGFNFEAVMDAAQKGDQAAYSSLLRKVAPLLRRLMGRRLSLMQTFDREDLIQDIMLSVHLARARYDSSRPFIPWLMSIAHNRMVDRVRRHRKRWGNEFLVDDFTDAISREAPEGAKEEYGDPEALHQAVRRLPAKQRSAIELVKLREMPLKEAAALSGTSTSALRVSVHRAIKRLRSSLVQLPCRSRLPWESMSELDRLKVK